jgi:hypothetical protein
MYFKANGAVADFDFPNHTEKINNEMALTRVSNKL